MVRGFFEAHDAGLERLKEGRALLAERWHWQPSEIDNLDFEDFLFDVEVVETLNKRDIKAAESGK